MKDIIILIVLIIIFIIISNYKHQQYKGKNYALEESGIFTLGQVIKYKPKTYYSFSAQPAFIRFSFKVKNKDFLGVSNYNVPEENGPQEGSLFIAVYLPSNPNECALLLDYPVKSIGDYNKYIEEFKTNRPKLDK
jgi:uncharacterized protein YxeA